MPITDPLYVALPPGPIKFLTTKSRRVQRAFPLPDGTLEKLSTVHNVVAQCLGYKSRTHLKQFVHEGLWSTLGAPDAEIKQRQRLRELLVLSAAFPHVKRESIEQAIDHLRIADWPVVERAQDPNTHNCKDAEHPHLNQRPTPNSPKPARQLSAARQPLRFESPKVWTWGNQATIKPKAARKPSPPRRPVRQSTVPSVAHPAARDPFMATQLSEAVDVSKWNTPDSYSLFIPPTMNFASEKARVLANICPNMSLAIAHAITARLYGYVDWFDLDARFRPGVRGKFDEELTSDARRELHQWQARFLQACLGITKIEAVAFRIDWQPTSQSLKCCDRRDYGRRPRFNCKNLVERPKTRLSGTIRLIEIKQRISRM